MLRRRYRTWPLLPCYNEEEMIGPFFSRVIPALERIPEIRFELLYVNDGSRDRTLERLVTVALADPRVRVIDLTRNFGKDAALTAAIFEARGDLIVPFDADLQDPPELIGALVEKWREGHEVVLARRRPPVRRQAHTKQIDRNGAVIRLYEAPNP